MSINWKISTLGEIADIKRGLPSQDLNYVDSNKEGVRLIRINDFKSDSPKYIKETSATKRLTVQKGDVLIAGTGATAGISYLVNELWDGLPFSYNAPRIRVNNGIDSRYIYFILNSNKIKSQQNKLFTGNAQPFLDTRAIASFKIPLPPLPEQQKIAEILSTVDAKIEVIDQQITETQALKKGLMQRLLTKGIGHTEFKDSALGEIPKSWEVKEIELMGIELIDGDRGSNYPKSTDFYEDEYCLFLSAKNVTKHGFRFSEKQFINKEKDNLLRKGKLTRNDFVITTRGSVGHIALYDDSIPFENVRLNSGMVILRDKKMNFNIKFLYQLLNSPMFESQVEFITSGSAQPQLTITALKKLKLPIPLLKEQIIIGDVLSTISDKLEVLSEKKTHYQELKQGLMQQLLTGKIRVNNLIAQI